MTAAWAIQIPACDATATARVRHLPGIEVCALADVVWLRGDDVDDDIDDESRHDESRHDEQQRLLRTLPAAGTYAVLDDGQLLPRGARVPAGRLPQGPWEPLRDWLQVELAPAALPARVPQRVPLTLVRSSRDGDADLLRVDLALWRDYGGTAPQVRLNHWSFAVDAQQRVLVRGRPLPPLPGERFVSDAGVAVPAGWSWQPALDARAIREVLGLATDELALVRADGAWERLHETDFVQATRSAIRQTAASLTAPATGAAHDL